MDETETPKKLEKIAIGVYPEVKALLDSHELSKSDSAGDLIKSLSLAGRNLPEADYICKWFIKNYEMIGFEKLISYDKNKYPRFIMKYKDKVVRVDIERYSREYIFRKLPIDTVDIIVCFCRDEEPEGIKVMEIPIKYMLQEV